MDDRWRFVVDAAVYNAEYYPDLGPQAVHGTARALLIQPLSNFTREQEYEALRGAIHTGPRPLTSVPTRYDDAAIRDYLARIVRRLDEFRPWPELPFEELSVERWREFASAPTVAQINASFPYVQDKIGSGFRRPPEDNHEYLLIRLRSGVEVGFVWPNQDDAGSTAVVCSDTRYSPRKIIAAILEASLLPSEMVVPR